MPTERIAMRRVREMLKLKLEGGLSTQEVARRTGVARSTLREMFARFEQSGLAWPIPAEIGDPELEVRLYGERGSKRGHRRQTEPDWAMLNRELKRKHVTLQILWDEYIEVHPDGYKYSRFCELYRAWERRLPVTMRQTYLGGEKLFVDYAGDTVPVIVNGPGGLMRAAHIFVAVMGASSLSFALATWSETLIDWVEGHVRAFDYFGGAPSLVVPDNPKVAVIKACFYDPQVNRTYADLISHYDTAVLPARPRKPRDKAKVEAAVRIVERWLLGKLRHRRFHSLADVNAAIAELLRPQGLRHAEWLALLLDRESVHRQDKRLGARLRSARLRHQACPEDIDYRAARGLDRRLMQALLKGDWITAHENLAITGPTGAGKSWLACALGHQACRDNHAVLYVRVPKLFDELTLAHGDGSAGRRLKALGAVQVLILDDWGLTPLDDQARHDLLEILEDRYGRRSTLITSQLPVPDWHSVIGQATYADAILDRLVHNAHRIELTGDSLRKTRPAAATPA